MDDIPRYGLTCSIGGGGPGSEGGGVDQEGREVRGVRKSWRWQVRRGERSLTWWTSETWIQRGWMLEASWWQENVSMPGRGRDDRGEGGGPGGEAGEAIEMLSRSGR